MKNIDDKKDVSKKIKTKKEVEQMVKYTLNSEKLPKLDDTVDAIAIAICHSRNLFV